MEKLYGLYAAKILSYDSAKKTAQVSVEPYTTGAEKGITAKLAYPVGFDDQDTELSINGQPDVWVFFERGEFKNPVVAFFRTRQSSSVSDVFRIRQKRIEFHAEEILFNAKTQTTKLATFDIDAVAAGVSVVKHGHGNVKNGEGVTSQPIPTSAPNGAPSNTGKFGQSSNSSSTEGNQDPITIPEESSPLLDDTFIEFFNENGLIEAGKIKVWSGVVTANSTWTCDYSSAGFSVKPALYANGIPVNGFPVMTSIDTASATITNCSGFAFSSALDLEKGCLASVNCEVIVTAIGI
ncbi:hypothetical protein [Acinetobacter baumannii]|uniref:hypothetical protein n=1 Tax=Acinetobacter baumannii TaxID=470 RepID=UPI0024B6D280|nr:hypothetical protein [Acinetobacter baumannii]MDI9759639.1 hypothetical protein [Acinetobacter baumannii]